MSNPVGSLLSEVCRSSGTTSIRWPWGDRSARQLIYLCGKSPCLGMTANIADDSSSVRLHETMPIVSGDRITPLRPEKHRNDGMSPGSPMLAGESSCGLSLPTKDHLQWQIPCSMTHSSTANTASLSLPFKTID